MAGIGGRSVDGRNDPGRAPWPAFLIWPGEGAQDAAARTQCERGPKIFEMDENVAHAHVGYL